MKKVVRYLCLGFLVLAFGIGQFLSRDLWLDIFSFSRHHHPRIALIVGGLMVFAVVPALALTFAISGFVRTRWRAKCKAILRSLAACSLGFALLILTDLDDASPTGGVVWLFLILPFAFVHGGASLGYCATLDEKAG